MLSVSLLVLYLGAHAYRRAKQAERDATYQYSQTATEAIGAMQSPTSGDMSSSVAKSYTKLPAHTQKLCQGFKRAQQDLPAMRLQFEQLSLSIPRKGKEPLIILKGVTGSVEPGKVTAVMGPSGAGMWACSHHCAACIWCCLPMVSLFNTPSLCCVFLAHLQARPPF